MKTDLEHLPARKQRELARVQDILFEGFEEATRAKGSPKRQGGLILKIILFGSHATGKWVEDPDSGYSSDYDLMILVNDEEFTDMSVYWWRAEDRILRDKAIKTEVNCIIHDLGQVNAALRKGEYFYWDVIEQGVMLYDLREGTPSGQAKYKLATPTPPDPQIAYEQAKKYFEFWMEKAKSSFRMHSAAVKMDELNKAAFELHQATEQLYSALLLTHTLYLPPSHNIRFLRSRSESIDPTLIPVWPRDKRIYKRRFELLKRAYVESRYSEHYSIEPEDLEWLAARIEGLQARVTQSCKAWIEELRVKAEKQQIDDRQ